MPHKVPQSPAALRAAVFRYLRKTSGGGDAPTPPVRARVKHDIKLDVTLPRK